MAEIRQFDRLEISGFRGLSTFELSDLGAFNLLFGANDVGKTSILEAIMLVCNLTDSRLPIRLQNGRNFLVQEIDDLLAVFSQLDFGACVSVKAYRHHSEYRKLAITAPRIDSSANQKSIIRSDISSTGTTSGSRPNRVDRQSLSFALGSRVLQYDAEVKSATQEEPLLLSVRLVDLGEKWGIDPEDTGSRRADLAVPAALLGPTSGYNPERIGKVVIEKRDELLIEYLRIINPRVSRISVLGEVAYVDIGLAQMMPLNMFGSGMIRASMVLTECILNDVRVLLIDELEYGLHYRAIPSLLSTLIGLSHQMGIQVFATTHSVDVLKALQQVLQKDGLQERRATTTCYAMQRDDGDRVRSYRYDYDQFEHCIRNEMEIR